MEDSIRTQCPLSLTKAVLGGSQWARFAAQLPCCKLHPLDKMPNSSEPVSTLAGWRLMGMLGGPGCKEM